MALTVALTIAPWLDGGFRVAAAWPLSYTPLWLLLLSLVVFDSVRSQRRINACQGEIKLLMDARLRWQGVNGKSSERRGC
jgi:toxin CptA